jgi:hypothetical protein
VFVKDVARANYLAATAKLPAVGPLDARAFNVGTGIETSVNTLAATLRTVAGSDTAVERAPARAGELQRSALVIDKAARELGWRPEVSLEDGLRETYEFFAARHAATAARLTVRRSRALACSSRRTRSSGPLPRGAPPCPRPRSSWWRRARSPRSWCSPCSLVLSLVSWGIALAKWLEFRRVTRAGRAFVREFEHARTIEDAEQLASRATPTPFTDVFRRAMVFLAETRPALAATADRGARLSGSQVEALRLVLDAETDLGRDGWAASSPGSPRSAP